MALFDASVVASAATMTSFAAVVSARRASGFRQHFLLALFSISMVSLLALGSALLLGRDGSGPGWVGVVGVLGEAGTMVLHLPSIVVLGGDENLERHGVLITTLGSLADLLLWALLGTVLTTLLDRVGLMRSRESSADAALGSQRRRYTSSGEPLDPSTR